MSHPKATDWGARYQQVLPASEGEVVELFENAILPRSPAHLVTLQFAVLGTFASRGSGVNADVHARVEYSCGAVTNAILCDWRGQLSLAAHRIKVSLQTYAPNGVRAYSAASKYQWGYGCALALGAAPSRDRIYYTPSTELIDVVGTADAISVADVHSVGTAYHPMLLVTSDGTGVASSCRQPTDEDLDALKLVIAANASGNDLLSEQSMTREILARGMEIPGGSKSVYVRNYGSLQYLIAHRWRLLG